MGWITKYDLEFKGLKEGFHKFEYEIEDEFFKHFEQGLVSKGSLTAKVILEKRSTFLKLNFYIKGWVELVCDRCLEKYQQYLIHEDEVYVKFGKDDNLNDDKIMWVLFDEHCINLGQLIYEFIIISIPLKHIHQEDENGESGCNKDMIREIEKYSYHGNGIHEPDPRWAVLKNIRNNN
jgi:uncharacterized protein